MPFGAGSHPVFPGRRGPSFSLGLRDLGGKRFRRSPRRLLAEVRAGEFWEIALLSLNDLSSDQQQTADKNQFFHFSFTAGVQI